MKPLRKAYETRSHQFKKRKHPGRGLVLGDALGLNVKQRLFCLEYLEDLDGTASAIRAGYAPADAWKVSKNLLSNPKVQKVIQRHMDARQARSEVTVDRVVLELWRIASADPGELYNAEGNLKPIHEIPEELRRAISHIQTYEEYEGRGSDRVHIGSTKKVLLWDKLKALELLGKYLKIFFDSPKIQVNSRNTQINMMNRFDFSGFTTEELKVIASAGFKLIGDGEDGEKSMEEVAERDNPDTTIIDIQEDVE